MARSSSADLEQVLEAAADDFRQLANSRILVTGGSGFVGTWMLESLLWAVDRMSLTTRVVVLARDPAAFEATRTHLARHPQLELVPGDVRTLATIPIGTVDALVHAASPVAGSPLGEAPQLVIDTIVDGMRAAIEVAQRCGSVPLLFTSSGAVYGRQPPEIAAISEAHLGGPNQLDPSNAYHEGKRVAELLGAISTEAKAAEVKIARLFAFVGPHLPIDRQFAIGNFVRDGLAGGPIVVRGDGSAVRSYLYGADLAWWLWRILIRGTPGRAYNVGSKQAISIAETAALVARACPTPCEVMVLGQPDPHTLPERYVPSTDRAHEELGLGEQVGLESAIERTLAWHRSLG